MGQISIRVDDSWLASLNRLLTTLGLSPDRERSRAIRDMVTQECHTWQLSPYFSVATRCFVFVDRSGKLGYWLVHELYLVEALEQLPCSLSIKPEKKRAYEHDETSPLEHWLLNYSAAWKGERLGERLLADGFDPLGATTKHVDLEIRQNQDTRIVREIFVVMDDYVQRAQEGVLADDRADVSVHLPTQFLEIELLVDLDLYQNAFKRRDANLSYEIRNRERVRLSNKLLGVEGKTVQWSNGRYTSKSTHQDATCRRVVDKLEAFQARLADLLVGKLKDGRPIVRPRHEDALRSLSKPSEYLYGHLAWPRPYLGLNVCGTWNMPDPVPE